MPGGLVRHYQHQRDHTPNPERRRDAERVLEDLRSLCRAAQAYDEQNDRATLTGFLEHAAGLHAQEFDAATARRITVSTIHRAKGTEAEAVALLGCKEELLPSWRSISSPDLERLAEERRLFYVAATRAKDRLLITHVAERGRRPTGGPSRFLTEAGLDQAPQLAGRLSSARPHSAGQRPLGATGAQTLATSRVRGTNQPEGRSSIAA
jgi:DNA helicase-2/ATP-dependent DNA helicase PcrA